MHHIPRGVSDYFWGNAYERRQLEVTLVTYFAVGAIVTLSCRRSNMQRRFVYTIAIVDAQRYILFRILKAACLPYVQI